MSGKFMDKQLKLEDLPQYMNKKVYKEQLSNIFDTKIILADAARDDKNKSFGTLVFFGTEYDINVLNEIRASRRPAIYIHNLRDITENGELIHYAE